MHEETLNVLDIVYVRVVALNYFFSGPTISSANTNIKTY